MTRPFLRHWRGRVVALTTLGLLTWTQLFLGVHELSHLGQSDASACRFALVASTVGGGGVAAQPILFAPLSVATVELPLVASPELPGILSTQQARAPPLPS